VFLIALSPAQLLARFFLLLLYIGTLFDQIFAKVSSQMAFISVSIKFLDRLTIHAV
jgi:hypothetical protein